MVDLGGGQGDVVGAAGGGGEREGGGIVDAPIVPEVYRVNYIVRCIISPVLIVSLQPPIYWNSARALKQSSRKLLTVAMALLLLYFDFVSRYPR